MDANEIYIKLRAISYRVVPEYNHDFHRFEIIVEPWDYENNKRIRSRKIKRSGVFIPRDECRASVKKETKFGTELVRIQLAVIEHYEKKQKQVEHGSR